MWRERTAVLAGAGAVVAAADHPPGAGSRGGGAGGQAGASPAVPVRPFVAALIVAALLNPAVRWLQRRLGWSRKLLSLLLVVVIFGVIGGCLGILTYAAANELVSLAQNWSGMLTQVEGFFDQMEALFARAMDLLPLSVVGTVEDTVNALIQRLQAVDPTALLSAAKAATDWAMRVPEFLLALVVFVMASYFLTADYPYHRTRAVQHLDESLLRFLQQVKVTALAAFGGYLRRSCCCRWGCSSFCWGDSCWWGRTTPCCWPWGWPFWTLSPSSGRAPSWCPGRWWLCLPGISPPLSI